jgi:hypothetical protein
MIGQSITKSECQTYVQEIEYLHKGTTHDPVFKCPLRRQLIGNPAGIYSAWLCAAWLAKLS